jgi:hypothetical protein
MEICQKIMQATDTWRFIAYLCSIILRGKQEEVSVM